MVEKPEGLTGYSVMVGNERIYYVSAGYCKDPKSEAQRVADEYNEKGYYTA